MPFFGGFQHVLDRLFHDLGLDQIEQGPAFHGFFLADAEHGPGPAVGQLHAAVHVYHHDAFLGGEKDGLRVLLLADDAVHLHVGVGLELGDHGVEGLGQVVKLVGGVHLGFMGEIPGGDVLGGPGEDGDRLGKAAAEEPGGPHGQGQEQEHGVNGLALHEKGVAVGAFLRLADDNGAAQFGDRGVGAQHLPAGLVGKLHRAGRQRFYGVLRNAPPLGGTHGLGGQVGGPGYGLPVAVQYQGEAVGADPLEVQGIYEGPQVQFRPEGHVLAERIIEHRHPGAGLHQEAAAAGARGLEAGLGGVLLKRLFLAGERAEDLHHLGAFPGKHRELQHFAPGLQQGSQHDLLVLPVHLPHGGDGGPEGQVGALYVGIYFGGDLVGGGEVEFQDDRAHAQLAQAYEAQAEQAEGEHRYQHQYGHELMQEP